MNTFLLIMTITLNNGAYEMVAVNTTLQPFTAAECQEMRQRPVDEDVIRDTWDLPDNVTISIVKSCVKAT